MQPDRPRRQQVGSLTFIQASYVPISTDKLDNDGIRGHNVRVRWWGESAITYPAAAILPEAAHKALPDTAIPEQAHIPVSPDKPVLLGHYWMTGTPILLSLTAVCVDYSAGNGRELLVYRWDGETELDAVAHFAWVG